MARPRKGPWRRNGQGVWYTTVGRKTIRVADASDSYEDAFKKYVEILAAEGDSDSEAPGGLIRVKALFDRFLRWSKLNNAPQTFDFYSRYLGSFQARHGTKQVSAIKPRHVEDWIERDYAHCTSTTRSDLIKAVVRALNWGRKKGYYKHNPLTGMEKPKRKPRELVLTPEQFAELLTYVPDQEFRDYLEFLWNTGCRAMEIRVIEKRHVDGSAVTLLASEAKGKEYARVIYLNDAALAIVQRLCLKHPTGPIFRTTAGKPWTANSVRCRFTRKTRPGKTKKGKERKPQGLAAKMGLPGLCATTIRHSWATNALKAGMDTTTASILMGHRDPATLIRNYQHLAKDKAYLSNAVNALRFNAPVPPSSPQADAM